MADGVRYGEGGEDQPQDDVDSTPLGKLQAAQARLEKESIGKDTQGK